VTLMKRLKRAIDAFRGLAVPTPYEVRALSFACAALEILERSSKWGNDTCRSIGAEAVHRGLGCHNEYLEFERTTDAVWLGVITPLPGQSDGE
jgi:hypothetical protein